MDDLEPVPHAWHAAIVRSQLAHARVTVDATAALAADGVRGVLTGEDVERLSKPFPAGIESPAPHYAAAIGTARYVGEPLAVVVARDRYVAEDAAELVAVDYEPLEPVVDPAAAPAIHDRQFHYGDVDEALARAHLVGARDVPCAALHVHAARVLRRRLRLGRGRRAAHRVGELPGAVHAPRGRRRGARPARRPAPARHPAGLGRLVRRQGRRPSVRGAHRPRLARARRARALDGGPARASRCQLCLDGAAHRARGRLHGRRRARCAPLRRDRGRRRVRARTRARHALPHARLAVGRLPGAERRRPESRRAHQHDPVRPEPGLRRAAAVLRARADDGDRRAPARARSRRPRAPEPGRRRRHAVPHAVRGAVRLGRLRRLPRPRARALGLRRPACSCVERESGGEARGRRTGLRRRAVDLEHGVHHPGADGRGARRDAAEVGERRGRLGRDRPPRGDHRPAGDDAAGPGAPHGVCPGRRRRARLRPRGRHRPLRARHRDDPVDGRVRQLLVAVLRRRRRCGAGRRPQGAREGRRHPRPCRRPGRVAAARRGDGSLEPREPSRRAWSPVSPRSRSTRRRTSTLRMPRTGWRRPEPTAWSWTSAPSRSTARPGP